MSNQYFPFLSGRYEVRTGMQSLGTDYGNGEQDKKVFQIDEQREAYLQEKRESCRQLAEYYLVRPDLPDSVLQAVTRGMVQKMSEEYPQLFSINGESFRTPEQGISLSLASQDLFHQVAMTVQEDFSIMHKQDGEYRLCLLHVLLPNYWSPGEKINTRFAKTHAPVPHMQNINRVSQNLFDHIIDKGPFVRFAWGLTADRQLNCHPRLRSTGHLRDIQAGQPVYIRVERQLLWGFAEASAVLFCIRTYHYDSACLNTEQRTQLLSAVNSMDKQVLEYKGLNKNLQQILANLA